MEALDRLYGLSAVVGPCRVVQEQVFDWRCYR
jgi:hypothetical protein